LRCVARLVVAIIVRLFFGGLQGARMLKNLQAMRGIAALMVLLIHLLSMRDGLGADWLHYKYWWVGPAGVDVFFVISGFIVTTAAWRQGTRADSQGSAALEFGLKRLIRIYPVYWVVLAAALVVAPHAELAPAWLPSMSLMKLATLTTTINNKVQPAWTLCYEMFFYLVLTAILFSSPKRVFQLVGMWAGLQLLAWAITFNMSNEIRGLVIFSPMLLEFMLGAAVAYVISRRLTGFAIPVLVGGGALFALGCYVNASTGQWLNTWIRALCFGLPSAMLIYAVVALEERKIFVFPIWLCRVGDASYSIYIWHQLVLAVLMVATGRLGLYEKIPGLVILSVWAGATLVVGFASYKWIEKPSLAFFNKLLLQRAIPGEGALSTRAIGRPEAV
jgi:exopolysaccharide production protein ExoZ